jgi:hypothetical protein
VWSKDDLAAMLINPIYAISIQPDLVVQHEPLVSRDQWIKTNTKLIDELGAEQWLSRLLEVLEGGYPASAEDAGAAFGYRSDD